MNTISQVLAAGIIPVSIVNQTLQILLLKDSNDKKWGVPKGIKEYNESNSECAIRELGEETQIRVKREELLLGVNYVYSYYLPCGRSKQVKLFPFFLNDTENIQVSLSSEHDEYKWIEQEELDAYIDYSNLRNILEQCFTNFKYSEASKQLRKQRRGIINEALTQSLDHITSEYKIDWYIGGSFAAGEESWSPNGLLSDIDLVAYGRNKIKPSVMYGLLRRVEDFAVNGLKVSDFPGISSVYLTKYSRVNANDPFWSYFSNQGVALNQESISNVIGLFEDRETQTDYNLYRLFWYSILDVHLGKNTDYHNVKKSVLLYVLDYIYKSKTQFTSYRDILNKSHDDSAKLVLNSKLHFLPPPNSAILNDSFVEKLDSLFKTISGNNRSDAYLLLRFLLEISKNIFTVTEPLLSRVGEVMGEKSAIAFENAINKKNLNSIYYLLGKFRLTRWPEETRWSYWRYEKLFTDIN